MTIAKKLIIKYILRRKHPGPLKWFRVGVITRYVNQRGNVVKKSLQGNGKTNERALIYALPPRTVIYDPATYSTHARLSSAARREPTLCLVPVPSSEKT